MPRSSPSDSADVRFPPPVLFGLGFGLGWVLEAAWPTTLASHGLRATVGWTLLSLGAGTLLLALREFRRQRTTIHPGRSSAALIESGPFRYTRNPLYLALTLQYVGVSLLLDTIWPLVFVLPVLGALRYWVIAREEEYLERRFGDEYVRYRNRVHRWLGRSAKGEKATRVEP